LVDCCSSHANSRTTNPDEGLPFAGSVLATVAFSTSATGEAAPI